MKPSTRNTPNTPNAPRLNLGCIFVIVLVSVVLSLLFYWLERA